MKRSQLREVIKTIISKKLQEGIQSSNDESQLAEYVKSVSGEFDKIRVQSHYGNESVEVVEWWVSPDKVLHLSINPQLNEIDTFNAPSSDVEQPSVTSDQPESDAVEMTDADKKALEDARAKQQKLTADRDKLRGAIQKLEEPVRRKVADANRKLASIEKKLGQESAKIQSIQNRYT